MPLEPAKLWWTAAEIAEARLPDMPTTTRGVDMVAKPWRGSTFARRRAGRGGGWEYHWEQFPIRAQRQLLLAVQVASVAAPAMPRGEAWAWFEGLPKAVQDKARGKLLILQQVEAMVATGAVGKFVAVALVANEALLGGKTVSARAIWDWFRLVDGVRADDRLPYLAPRHRTGPARKARLHCDVEFMDLIKSDYLRPAGPSFSTVYRRAMRAAVAQGLLTLPQRTMERRFKREVSDLLQVLARKGADALKSYFPSQTRDKSALHPMEAVNADFHKFDVFVEWPREPGSEEPPLITRPQMCAFQDIFSGMILSWRVDVNPNAVAVKLCAGDMIETWGIPEHVLFDNGREFCADSLTGGAANRFRWKMRHDDILGLFPELGCKMHFSTPYSGQSKPIERAFRDMCDAIAKDPRFDGAYTGNTPMAKPEDYGSRAIPLADFLRVLGEGIEEHNLRVGRRSEVACGRSFAAVFDEGYATAPIRKATEAQRRLWLLGAEGVTANRKTGLVKFMGNEYWAAWMHDVAGEKLIVRFDPANFFDGLHIYSAENGYLGHAPCKSKVGFFDTTEARLLAKSRRDWINNQKAGLKLQRRYTAAQLGEYQDAVAQPVTVKPEAKVVRGMFGKGGAKAARKPVDTLDAEALAVTQAVIVDDLAARRAGHVPEAAAEETPRARFQRALALEAQMTAGEPVTADQRRWLAIYQGSAECLAERMLWEDFGDASAG